MKQSGEELSTSPCQKCGAMTIYVLQPDDWWADYKIRCNTCGRVYTVDADYKIRCDTCGRVYTVDGDDS